MEIAWPSITASASIPPTPQPTIPNPLIIVVCESVPTTLSGYAIPSSWKTQRARYSKLTWWTIPEPGGTINMFLNAVAPHLRNWKRSAFLSNSIAWFFSNASGLIWLKLNVIEFQCCCFFFQKKKKEPCKVINLNRVINN